MIVMLFCIIKKLIYFELYIFPYSTATNHCISLKQVSLSMTCSRLRHVVFTDCRELKIISLETVQILADCLDNV